MTEPASLTIEQQFSICSFASQVQEMNREKAQQKLVELFKEMMIMENSYKQLLKQNWGI